MKHYFFNILIALDQLANAITGGGADETFSSRCYRGAILAKKPKKRWRCWLKIVNGLFFDKNHCKTAYESEVHRRQYPTDFTIIK
ncbi:DNA helicase UvrD [Seminibacterium arietis]|uniref:DNA helicase UvrD n=1 Tax=Seminibacterium arietis TaxID=1173502 RepID=A0ABW3I8H8_9PAST